RRNPMIWRTLFALVPAALLALAPLAHAQGAGASAGETTGLGDVEAGSRDGEAPGAADAAGREGEAAQKKANQKTEGVHFGHESDTDEGSGVTTPESGAGPRF